MSPLRGPSMPSRRDLLVGAAAFGAAGQPPKRSSAVYRSFAWNVGLRA